MSSWKGWSYSRVLMRRFCREEAEDNVWLGEEPSVAAYVSWVIEKAHDLGFELDTEEIY